MSVKRSIPPLLWVIVFQAIAYGIGLVTRDNMGWYRGLEKAAVTPPDIAFPIVWPILYVLIALSGWRVWQKRAEIGHAPLAVFAVYILLNWGWSFVFFAGQMILAGFIWIVLLDLVALGFIWLSWHEGERLAAGLMILPAAWTIFAAYLNYAIWILN